MYGDLDPRFLDRPAGPGDVTTAMVMNPTTHRSRKGNFGRNNHPDGEQPPPPPCQWRTSLPVCPQPEPEGSLPPLAAADVAVAAAVEPSGTGALPSGPAGPVADGSGPSSLGPVADGSGPSSLGLYVGPSLHENLAWRVKTAQVAVGETVI